MNNLEFKKISQLIKQVMKSKKLTYDDLAKQMGMSGSGLKKLLAADDCSINKLHSICKLLDLDIHELLKSSKELKSTEIKFTKAQEDFFLKNPNYFFFFWELVDNEMSLEKMRSLYNLDEKSVRKYLTALDKIGLIELHPGDVVKHRYHGKTHWNMVDSPIGQLAMVEFHSGFLKKLRTPPESPKDKRRKILRWINFKLRKSTYEEFVDASNDLLNEFIKRSQREKPLSAPEELIPIGSLMGVMEFRYPDIIKIPKIGA